MKSSHFIAACALGCCLATALFAQTRGVKIVVKTDDGRDLSLYQSSYALIVGISDYTAGWPDLPNAAQDARDVEAVLKKHGFETQVLLNPTSDQLNSALSDFMYTMGIQAGNRLLFYFAGHGYTMKMSYGSSMGYIVPTDAPLPDENIVDFRRKAISMQTFEFNARQIQAKHTLYLFDSCFSGSIFALSRAVPSAISYKTARAVRQFITAGDEGEEVPDKSIFKSQFLSALEGEGDLNQDGYITGTELGEYLQTTVLNYSKESQHPQYGKIRDPNLDKGDFVFVIPGSLQPEKPKGFELAQVDRELNIVYIKAPQDQVKQGDRFYIYKKNPLSGTMNLEIEDKKIFLAQADQIHPGITEAMIKEFYYDVSPQDLTEYYAEKIGASTLKVRTAPWSNVYVDGKKVGTTPLILQAVAPGEHELSFEAYGRPENRITERIQLKENEVHVIDKTIQ